MLTGLLVFFGLILTFMLTWALTALVLYSTFRRKALISNIAGCIAAFVACSIYINALPPSEQDLKRERMAAFLEEKKKELGPEKWAEIEAAAKSGRHNDRSIGAAIICANFFQDRLKHPDDADFPFDRADGGVEADTSSQTYSVRSYVKAMNDIGVSTRTNYTCRVRYVSGLESDKNSWILVSLTI